MVTMSNLCLKYVEVSFYQISRSLGIPMIPLINFVMFGEKSSLRTVLSCLSIVVGYIAGVDGEINFSLRGTLFGVGASAVGTFYTIYLKRYLSNVIDNRYLLTFYTNFNSCLILPFISILNGEVPIIWEHRKELTPKFFFWIYVCR
ncbi:GDP-fucose transporter [Blastocystis sp. subtype 4]|uniref:GDP-fucose transporter n=1 Tax=Blastocystis sp. subtype 4 TaxID=944170 RepID=UPI00071159E3|nr:GDP-fucose transporter [Blastocystis sp. subtype 4]KNB42531.1 GDP-fucose transporter [Blastocystis sp. subtype 4]|eukprot:XP_014525974.1 GDP-fucose transporter [Blastocystis sp. subtype 4]